MQSILDQFRAYAAAQRDEYIRNAQNGADDDLPPEERPTREFVAPGCKLKHGDEVEVSGYMTALVTCPGRGVGWFYGVTFDTGMVICGSWEAQNVTDRIPADSNETPMPIFSENP